VLNTIPALAPRSMPNDTPHQGIAGSMALQWVPLLLELIINQRDRSSQTAYELIEQHLSTTPQVHSEPAEIAAVIPDPATLPRVRIFVDSENANLPPCRTWVPAAEAAIITATRQAKRDRLGQPMFPVNTHTGPSSHFQPWLEQLPRVMLPRRPVRHVRRIRASWKAWRVIDEGPEARVYGWVPLSDTLNEQLDLALTGAEIIAVLDIDERMPESTTAYGRAKLVPTLCMILEEWNHPNPPGLVEEPPLENHAGWEEDCCGSQSLPPRVVGSIFMDTPLHTQLRKTWDTQVAPSKSLKNLGLGATQDTEPTPSIHRMTSEILTK
jgi:hypothetical protein